MPARLREAELGSRAELHRRSTMVDAAWWNAVLADHGLPGGPVGGHPGLAGWTAPAVDGPVGGGRLLARVDLFALARELYLANVAGGGDPPSGAAAGGDTAGGSGAGAGRPGRSGLPGLGAAGLAALRVWWHVAAWDAGTAPGGRVDVVRTFSVDLVAAARVLREAAAVAAGCPEAAYAWLRTGLAGLNGMTGNPPGEWEPGTQTAFLYVAGGGCQNHPCLVLNGAIARALAERCGWESLDPAGWSAPTYGAYCRLVRRWAVEETARRHRLVYPDQLERWLATAG